MTTTMSYPPSITSPSAERTRQARFDREYWLAHCEGFQVDSPHGRLGIVEEVIPSAGDRPGLLAVRGGFLGRRLTLVSTDEVAFVVPRALRVYVNHGGG